MTDQDRVDLREFVEGKPQAAKRLISRYSSPLHNHACYILGGDQAMAEDLVQNTFLKLWQKASSLLSADRELQLKAWLFRVLRNSCLDELRRVQVVEWDEEVQIMDHSLNVETQIEHQDKALFVWTLVSRLPERQKSALLMRHFEDMSNPEIGVVLDCSVEAVENLLARARRSLKAWASEEEARYEIG